MSKQSDFCELKISGHVGISFAAAFGLFYLLFIPRNVLAVAAMIGLARVTPKRDMPFVTKCLVLNLITLQLFIFYFIFQLLWRHGNMGEMMTMTPFLGRTHFCTTNLRIW